MAAPLRALCCPTASRMSAGRKPSYQILPKSFPERMMPSCQDAEKCHHNFDKGQKCFVKGEAVVGAAREARELNSGNADHMM